MSLNRTTFVALLVSLLALAAVPLPSEAERKAPHIAVLVPHSAILERSVREQLGALGYREGETIVIDWRLYDSWDASAKMADELVRSHPDVVVVFGTPPARRLMDATKTIPVVFAVGDPVGSGLIASLSHPGANATGAAGPTGELSAKLLDLLKQLAPDVKRVLVIRNPSNPLSLKGVEQLQRLAPGMRVQLLVLEAASAADLLKSLERTRVRKGDAVLMFADLALQADAGKVTRAIGKTGLPAIYQDHAFAEAGGLVSYGPNPAEVARTVVTLTDKILRGASPADLPVEEVSELGLWINLKTAKEMGIEIPQSILTRADKIIR